MTKKRYIPPTSDPFVADVRLAIKELESKRRPCSVEQEKVDTEAIKELADKLYYFDLGIKTYEDRLNLASFIYEHGYRLSPTLPSQELLLTQIEIDNVKTPCDTPECPIPIDTTKTASELDKECNDCCDKFLCKAQLNKVMAWRGK